MDVGELENVNVAADPSHRRSFPVLALPESCSGIAAPASASRVLVCEDEWTIAMMIEEVLTAAGIDVMGLAPTAPAALALVAVERPTFAVTDIRLQGDDDGIVLAVRLWRDHGVRSLFVSGSINAKTRVAVEPAHPLGFVSKPFSRKELLAAVNRIAKQ